MIVLWVTGWVLFFKVLLHLTGGEGITKFQPNETGGIAKFYNRSIGGITKYRTEIFPDSLVPPPVVVNVMSLNQTKLMASVNYSDMGGIYCRVPPP